MMSYLVRPLVRRCRQIRPRSVLSRTRKCTPTLTSTPKRSFITVVDQYQRGVKLNFGKFGGNVGPGLRLNIPIYHTFYKVDMRDIIHTLERQEGISRDNVSFHVDAMVQFRVTDAEKAVLKCQNFERSTCDRAQLTIRECTSSLEIDEILHNRDQLSEDILTRLAPLEEQWGVRVDVVQLKDIVFDESMTRAMARKAEAERTAQAKIINAGADVETAKKYSEAAAIYKENPITLRLREFQLWQSVAREPNNFIAVVPSNLVDTVAALSGKTKDN